MRETVETRKRVYRFLYERRRDCPEIDYGKSDLKDLGDAANVDAALTFGMEMGHIAQNDKGNFALTAQGMLFAEKMEGI